MPKKARKKTTKKARKKVKAKPRKKTAKKAKAKVRKRPGKKSKANAKARKRPGKKTGKKVGKRTRSKPPAVRHEMRLVGVGLWMPPRLTLEAALIEHLTLFRKMAKKEIEGLIDPEELGNAKPFFQVPWPDRRVKPFWSSHVDTKAFRAADKALRKINPRVSIRERRGKAYARVQAPLFASCNPDDAGWESDRCDTILLDDKPWLAHGIVKKYDSMNRRQGGRRIAPHNFALLAAMPIILRYSYKTEFRD